MRRTALQAVEGEIATMAKKKKVAQDRLKAAGNAVTAAKTRLAEAGNEVDHLTAVIDDLKAARTALVGTDKATATATVEDVATPVATEPVEVSS